MDLVEQIIDRCEEDLLAVLLHRDAERTADAVRVDRELRDEMPVLRRFADYRANAKLRFPFFCARPCSTACPTI